MLTLAPPDWVAELMTKNLTKLFAVIRLAISACKADTLEHEFGVTNDGLIALVNLLDSLSSRKTPREDNA